MKATRIQSEMAVGRTHALLRSLCRTLDMAIPRVEIRLDLRGRSAGMVRTDPTGTQLIRYNPVLLAENCMAFMEQTIPHEVAHVIVACRFRGRVRPHGQEWQSVMRMLGAEPRRCHDYDTSRSAARRLTRYRFECGCREHQITAIRRNRILAGQHYLCRQCGEALTEPAAGR